MLDLTFIRANPDVVQKAATDKKVAVDIQEFLGLDAQRRQLQTEIGEIQQQRNAAAKQQPGGKPTPEAIEAGKALREQLQQLETKYSELNLAFTTMWEAIPNIPSADTPVGKDESDNQVLRQVGDKPQFDFPPLDHVALGTSLGLIDNERAAKVTGSRFTYLKGELAWLEFALVQHALHTLTNVTTLTKIAKQAKLEVPLTPFMPILPPVLINPSAMSQMARLEPKDERYYIPSDDLYLIGSAEHTVGAMHMAETFAEADVPQRYLAFSSSFRRESGSYGKDVKGILRMHQFDKLEMESFSLPENSLAEQDFFVAIQEYLMQSLELPYQVVLTCTGDMGGPDARHIDIETWLPGQDQYRETHSADLMTDYQSRRLKTKVKRADGTTQLVHMNDATAFAIGRTLIAIMENNQQADGSIAVPKVLQDYVPFKKIVTKKSH
jgi:seryl-tRNA synthetase